MNKTTTIMHREHVNILGISIDSTPKDQVLRQVQINVQKNKKFYITTPNPEQVMLAQDDELYKDILNSADISIPDGIGIIMANKFQILPRPRSMVLRFFTLLMQGMGVGFSSIFDRDWLQKELKSIKGRQLFIDLLILANKKGWNVCLVGDRLGSAKKAAKKLKASYLKVKLHPLDGPNVNNESKPRTATDKSIEKKVVEKINKIKPELVIVGFGAPRQEKWLYRLYDDMSFVGAMVVGGTFDYVSQKKESPPKWIDEMNLEWMWRLYKGDQKVKRVFKAFPRFAWEIFWQKLRVKK